jgi:hypothetical protein
LLYLVDENHSHTTTLKQSLVSVVWVLTIFALKPPALKFWIVIETCSQGSMLKVTYFQQLTVLKYLFNNSGQFNIAQPMGDDHCLLAVIVCCAHTITIYTFRKVECIFLIRLASLLMKTNSEVKFIQNWTVPLCQYLPICSLAVA